MSTAVRKWGFLLTAWKLNLAGAMEFRMSFFLTAGMMMLNNAVFLFFWAVYFQNFTLVKGWSLHDVMMMWAVGTAGFGLSQSLFGNALRIASLVAQGELDTYLTQPKPVLLNLLVNRMSLPAVGDLLFGVILYGIFGDHSAAGFLKYGTACIAVMLLNLSFYVLTQSLAFFIGNAEGLGYQFFMGFITLTTYPTDIFKGWGKIMLFTVIPAGFISYIPVGFLRDADAGFMAGTAAAILVFGAAAATVFHRGLARYSSGNRIGMRSG
ncbi:ABC transporter permease [Gorillibacterium sp. sgz5001074]|uniref:ABC transporter permease n=1 Tax=Gorillibacterium sp. sgz5001074 TaxID=3446695 RepID=UPI003F66CB73